MVEQFLQESIKLVANSSPMMEYKRSNIRDFYNQEISLFNHKKQQATTIESLLRMIKTEYGKTSLPLMRDTIDANLSEKESTYNRKNGIVMLTNYLSKLEGELTNDSRLRDTSIIKDFKLI